MWVTRRAWVVGFLSLGCSGAPGACFYDDFRLEEVDPWFGVRLDSAAGSGESCDEPVELRGEYQRCDEDRCVASKPFRSGIDYPVLITERWWVQVNYHPHHYVAAFKEECGSYTADVLLLQLGNIAPVKVYFDSRRFRAVDGPIVTAESGARVP